MLVVHTMLLGSLQWTILTQVKLALSTGKIFAVYGNFSSFYNDDSFQSYYVSQAIMSEF